MPLYLSNTIVGDGLTLESAFHPVGIEEPGSGWIDLRPDPSTFIGHAIVFLPTPNPDVRLIKIAESVSEVVGSPIRKIIQNKFKITITSDTFAEILAELLLVHAGTGKWKSLMPTRLPSGQKELQIWLGGLGKIWYQPIIAGGANLFFDNFDRADSTNLGANWTERLGNYQILSNLLQIVSVTSVAVAHTATISTADYTVQAIMNWASSSTGYQGVGGRRINYSTTDSNGYFWHAVAGGMNAQNLHKRINGAWTLLGSSLQTLLTATDYTVKLSMQGTTLKGYIDGVEKVSVTDTSLTAAGDACAKYDSNTIPSWNDFSVDDFAAGAQLAALASCQGRAQTDLSTQILLEAIFSGRGAASGDLQTAIRLESVALATGSTIANLLTAIQMETVASAQGSVSANFTTQILMVALLSGQGTAVASLSAPVAQLDAVGLASGSASAALITAIQLVASVSASASMIANLATAIRLEAVGSAQSVAFGDLTTAIRLAAIASGQASAIVNLATAIQLAASASFQTSMASDLTTQILFGAVSQALGSVLADLTTSIQLATQASISGSALADLTSGGSVQLEALASCQGRAQTDLSTQILLEAIFSGRGAASGDLQTAIRFAAIGQGNLSVIADLLTVIRLNAATSAQCSATVDLSTQILLEAIAQAMLSANANLTTAINLSAIAGAQGSMTADLSVQAIVNLIRLILSGLKIPGIDQASIKAPVISTYGAGQFGMDIMIPVLENIKGETV